MAGRKFSGAALRKARRDAHFSEGEFASKARITITQLRAIEGGQAEVGGGLAWDFADILVAQGAIRSVDSLYGAPPADNYRTSVASGVRQIDEPTRPAKPMDRSAISDAHVDLEVLKQSAARGVPQAQERLRQLGEAFDEARR